MKHITVRLTENKNTYFPLFLWYQRSRGNFTFFRLWAIVLSLYSLFLLFSSFLTAFGVSSLKLSLSVLFLLISCCPLLLEYELMETIPALRLFHTFWHLQDILRNRGTCVTSVEFSPDTILVRGLRNHQNYQIFLSPAGSDSVICSPKGIILKNQGHTIYLPIQLFHSSKTYAVLTGWLVHEKRKKKKRSSLDSVNASVFPAPEPYRKLFLSYDRHKKQTVLSITLLFLSVLCLTVYICLLFRMLRTLDFPGISLFLLFLFFSSILILLLLTAFLLPRFHYRCFLYLLTELKAHGIILSDIRPKKDSLFLELTVFGLQHRIPYPYKAFRTIVHLPEGIVFCFSRKLPPLLLPKTTFPTEEEFLTAAALLKNPLEKIKK